MIPASGLSLDRNTDVQKLLITCEQGGEIVSVSGG